MFIYDMGIVFYYFVVPGKTSVVFAYTCTCGGRVSFVWESAGIKSLSFSTVLTWVTKRWYNVTINTNSV